MQLRNWASIVSVSLLCVVSTVARGDTLLVTDSGVWGDTAPTTVWSAPDQTWSYSFLISSTALPDDVVLTAHGIHFQRDFSDFTYTLDGASVATDPSSITWYGTAWGGLLNVNFGTAAIPDASFEPFGLQAFDSSLTIIPGTYSYDDTYGVFFSGPSEFQPLTGDVVITDLPNRPVFSCWAPDSLGLSRRRAAGLARSNRFIERRSPSGTPSFLA
jgi:hypothetical protein